MSRQGVKKEKLSGRDLLITCKSGMQFLMRNVAANSEQIVEGHALSGLPLSIEISNIVKADWVDFEISITGSIYPPSNQTKHEHDPHASGENDE